MRQIIKVLVAMSLLLFVGCGSIYFVQHEKTDDSSTDSKVQDLEPGNDSKPTYRVRFDCEECNVVPKSGSHRDQRIGYYFDKEEGMCKQITYSTGPNCIPPPFKTLNECISCCGR